MKIPTISLEIFIKLISQGKKGTLNKIVISANLLSLVTFKNLKGMKLYIKYRPAFVCLSPELTL